MDPRRSIKGLRVIIAVGIVIVVFIAASMALIYYWASRLSL